VQYCVQMRFRGRTTNNKKSRNNNDAEFSFGGGEYPPEQGLCVAAWFVSRTIQTSSDDATIDFDRSDRLDISADCLACTFNLRDTR